MPYKAVAELPESVRDSLPKHAQEIYKEAFNSAWQEYADPSTRRDDASQEEVAHRVAWAAVKQKYEKDAHGRWVAKSTSDPQAYQSRPPMVLRSSATATRSRDQRK